MVDCLLLVFLFLLLVLCLILFRLLLTGVSLVKDNVVSVCLVFHARTVSRQNQNLLKLFSDSVTKVLVLVPQNQGIFLLSYPKNNTNQIRLFENFSDGCDQLTM